MSEKKEAQAAKTEKKDHPAKGNTKIKLIKNCIGAYGIADSIGTTRTVSEELAKKMIASKHAVEG